MQSLFSVLHVHACNFVHFAVAELFGDTKKIKKRARIEIDEKEDPGTSMWGSAVCAQSSLLRTVKPREQKTVLRCSCSFDGNISLFHYLSYLQMTLVWNE